MHNFIDISSYQATLNLVAAKSTPIQGVIIKATQGVNYVNPYCDTHFQQAKSCGLLRGFYHFAGDGNAEAEAQFFYNNCKNYFGEAIPVLDWEGVYENDKLVFDQTVDWVNRFVRRLHALSGTWCWIYANPWRFNQGGVEPNCARWVASYPEVSHPSFTQAASWDCPDADGNVVAWQFCSDGHVNGYDRDVDCSLYYGDEGSWERYAGGADSGIGESGGVSGDSGDLPSMETLENDNYKITVERK